jgi:hypothetical protein
MVLRIKLACMLTLHYLNRSLYTNCITRVAEQIAKYTICMHVNHACIFFVHRISRLLGYRRHYRVVLLSRVQEEVNYKSMLRQS